MTRIRQTALAAAALVAALALAGCTHDAPAPSPSASAPASPSAAPSTPASTAPAADVIDMNASADANKAAFDRINEQTLAAHPKPLGSDFTNALAAAGVPKTAMQVTADITTAKLVPGSLLFSVLVDGNCLLGQYGSSAGGYHSEVVAPVSTGACMIGNTVPVQ